MCVCCVHTCRIRKVSDGGEAGPLCEGEKLPSRGVASAKGLW